MKNKVAALLAPFVLAAGPALSADLPRGAAPPPGDYVAPPPAFVWSGFYVGVHGGYAFSSFEDDANTLIGGADGGLIGVTGGYNYMVTPQFLLGVEADFAFTGVSKSNAPFFGVIARGEVDDMLTLRGRAGYSIDRALLYVTGGFAASKNAIGLTTPFTGFYGYQATFQPGWALGAGVEYMITSNLSAKGEYIFTSTGSDSYFDFSPNALTSAVNTSSIKGGLNFHF